METKQRIIENKQILYLKLEKPNCEKGHHAVKMGTMLLPKTKTIQKLSYIIVSPNNQHISTN